MKKDNCTEIVKDSNNIDKNRPSACNDPDINDATGAGEE